MLHILTKLINLEPGSLRKRRKDTKKQRNERGETTTGITERQTITRGHYEQLHPNKLDNLEEMDKFLETHSLPIRKK